MMQAALWILLAFFLGALPLSYWLGRIALKVDIRQYGDGNPGAANVWRAGGRWWGLLAILLDAAKGLIGVALGVYIGGLQGWALFPLGLAPILGHAYTPFLNFQGGKSLAITFGVWTALTLYEAPIVLGLALGFWLWVLRTEGWATLAGTLTLLAYLLIWHPDPVLISLAAANSLLLTWRYREYLQKKPVLFGRKPDHQ